MTRIFVEEIERRLLRVLRIQIDDCPKCMSIQYRVILCIAFERTVIDQVAWHDRTTIARIPYRLHFLFDVKRRIDVRLSPRTFIGGTS